MGRVFNRDGPSGQQRALWGITNVSDLIPRRFSPIGVLPTSNDEALKNSAVWAAIRIRADLISTLPWRNYRNYVDPEVNDGTPFKLDVAPTPLMTGVQFMHFLYSSQVELDRSGNAVGIIRAWDERTKTPAEIDLQPSSACTAHSEYGKITAWYINGVKYDPETIWHEKQYTVAGLPVGLSPVQYAIYTLGQYRSIQEFASDFFSSGQGPRASLQNTEKTISTKDAAVVAESWRASQSLDEPFIHGKDWDYKLVDAQSASTDWIEGSKLTEIDVARFFNVPADLIDAAISGGSHVTYSNIIQRNLQFLVMNLGPTITRREAALSDMLPRPRQFEFDTDYLMRMDPVTRAQWIHTQIDSRTLTPSEARVLAGRAPLTTEQCEEFFTSGLVHGKVSVMPGDPMDANNNPAFEAQMEANGSGN